MAPGLNDVTVYLDHNATTPMAREALEAMLPFLEQRHGNPSSRHGRGRDARAAVDRAREQVAALVKVRPSQVIFTSGATEANNLALKGWSGGRPGARLAVGATEHPSVLSPALALRQHGCALGMLAVDSQGRIVSEALEEALAEGAGLVSVMLANNETGVIQDLRAISELAHERGALVHTDAAQAAGRIEVDFEACGADMMSLSAHKLSGPAGAGALVVGKTVDLEPLIHGGGQEHGLRAGTENVAAIVGFGAAAELALRRGRDAQVELRALRDYLELGLSRLPGAVIFASDAPRLPNTVFLALPGLEGETVVMLLDEDGIAVSSGSSCSSGATEPSHVLMAMGVEPEVARCAIRVSLGPGNTRADIDTLIAALEKHLYHQGAMPAGFLAAS